MVLCGLIKLSERTIKLLNQMDSLNYYTQKVPFPSLLGGKAVRLELSLLDNLNTLRFWLYLQFRIHTNGKPHRDFIGVRNSLANILFVVGHH